MEHKKWNVMRSVQIAQGTSILPSINGSEWD